MARLDMDRFTEVGTGEEGMAVSDQQPKLNKIMISCEMELEAEVEKIFFFLSTRRFRQIFSAKTRELRQNWTDT
jgi:hypothetical protein